MLKISDSEFLTSSDDMSFKIWDRDLVGCSYTYETHDPLYRMRITGEKKDLLISALGEGNFMVFGLDKRNQHDIIEGAHDAKIVQIVNLSNGQLGNKYFATRCTDGDFSIWSAYPHPDQVFTIPNMDKAGDPNNQVDTNRDAHEEQTTPRPVEKEESKEEGAEDEEEEEEYDENGDPIEKKKKAPVVVKKVKPPTSASDKDQMIEINWSHTVIQSSATVLAFSNYNDQVVNLGIIDLKMRNLKFVKTFKLSAKPTVIYQVDDNNMLFGTEGGKIEHWTIDNGTCKNIYQAHPESDAGISSILELQTKSELLRGEPLETSQNIKLIATASEGAKEFRLWKLNLDNQTLHPYLKIETTISGGIKYLVESQDTQIVAANEKCIKFYDFIDKSDKTAKD